jgi:hypothetical protein
MRIALAVLMALHGFAHLVGFAVPFRLLRSVEMPYSTSIVAGRVDLGDAGVRAWGVLWLLACVAFLTAAGGAWLDRSGWVGLAVAVSIASLLLSVLAWPASRIGVPVNLVILTWIWVGVRRDWF